MQLADERVIADLSQLHDAVVDADAFETALRDRPAHQAAECLLVGRALAANDVLHLRMTAPWLMVDLKIRLLDCQHPPGQLAVHLCHCCRPRAEDHLLWELTCNILLETAQQEWPDDLQLCLILSLPLHEHNQALPWLGL